MGKGAGPSALEVGKILAVFLYLFPAGESLVLYLLYTVVFSRILEKMYPNAALHNISR